MIDHLSELVADKDSFMGFWQTYGRTFFARYDYEHVDQMKWGAFAYTGLFHLSF
jgi:phosphoglucomutase